MYKKFIKKRICIVNELYEERDNYKSNYKNEFYF